MVGLLTENSQWLDFESITHLPFAVIFYSCKHISKSKNLGGIMITSNPIPALSVIQSDDAVAP